MLFFTFAQWLINLNAILYVYWILDGLFRSACQSFSLFYKSSFFVLYTKTIIDTLDDDIVTIVFCFILFFLSLQVVSKQININVIKD